MSIRDGPTAPQSPWQNGYVGVVIGSIRHEYLDHVIVFGETHLRRIIYSYAGYSYSTRTRYSMENDPPDRRATQDSGAIKSMEWLGGKLEFTHLTHSRRS